MATNITFSDPITFFLETPAPGRKGIKDQRSYYKVKVTDTGRVEGSTVSGDPKAGRPILTYEVLRYDSASAASADGVGDGVVVGTRSSEDGASGFSFTSNASVDEKISKDLLLKNIKPGIDDAGEKMMLSGADNARLRESFSRLGSSDLPDLTQAEADFTGGDANDGGAPLPYVRPSERYTAPNKVLTGSTPIRYPLDLKSEDQDVLKITIKHRKPRRLEGGQQQGRKNGKTNAVIILPIQSRVEDGMTVDYSNGQLNFAEAFAVGAIRTALTNEQGKAEEGSAIGGAFGDMMKNVGANIDGIEQLIGNVTAGSVLKTFGSGATGSQLLARQDGLALNPNLELLFKGPTLRNFGFQYRFSPRSAAEGRIVKQIINFFKRSMAPKRSNGGGFFLTTPDVFLLQYLHKGSDHTSLNRFKTCALKTCQVNYAPDGTYATFPDGVMHSYVMTLGFTEIDPVFAEDYDNSDDLATGLFSGSGPLAPSILDEARGTGSNIGF
jgi:hypothetical protein